MAIKINTAAVRNVEVNVVFTAPSANKPEAASQAGRPSRYTDKNSGLTCLISSKGNHYIRGGATNLTVNGQDLHGVPLNLMETDLTDPILGNQWADLHAAIGEYFNQVGRGYGCNPHVQVTMKCTAVRPVTSQLSGETTLFVSNPEVTAISAGVNPYTLTVDSEELEYTRSQQLDRAVQSRDAFRTAAAQAAAGDRARV